MYNHPLSSRTHALLLKFTVKVPHFCFYRQKFILLKVFLPLSLWLDTYEYIKPSTNNILDKWFEFPMLPNLYITKYNNKVSLGYRFYFYQIDSRFKYKTLKNLVIEE